MHSLQKIKLFTTVYTIRVHMSIQKQHTQVSVSLTLIFLISLKQTWKINIVFSHVRHLIIYFTCLSFRFIPLTKAWMMPPMETKALIWSIMAMVWLTTQRKAALAFPLVSHTAQTRSVLPCLWTLDERWWCSSAWGWPTWSSQMTSLTRAPQNTKLWSNASWNW